MEARESKRTGRMLKTESASPLYAQIIERIRQDIIQGAYPVGSRIPAEHELEKRYGVSRVTVRRALQELTDGGMLERKQGKGTFVSQPRSERQDRPLRGFHDECREMGRIPSVKSIRIREIPAQTDDRALLNLGEEASLLEIRRVLAADGEPVILEICRFSTAYSWLEGAGQQASLYRVLQEYGIQAEKSIYDLSLVPAGKEEAALLGIPEGKTLISSRQLVYDQKGRPLHTALRLIRGDRFTLRI